MGVIRRLAWMVSSHIYYLSCSLNLFPYCRIYYRVRLVYIGVLTHSSNKINSQSRAMLSMGLSGIFFFLKVLLEEFIEI